jgi:hypothetical protein
MASSSEVETTCAIRQESVTGSQLLKVFGNSLTKGIIIGKGI